MHMRGSRDASEGPLGAFLGASVVLSREFFGVSGRVLREPLGCLLGQCRGVRKFLEGSSCYVLDALGVRLGRSGRCQDEKGEYAKHTLFLK